MPMVVVMSGAVAPASRVGALLAGVLIACWLVAGAVWLLPVARRASARASRPAPPRLRPRTRRRHREGPGRLVLALRPYRGGAAAAGGLVRLAVERGKPRARRARRRRGQARREGPDAVPAAGHARRVDLPGRRRLRPVRRVGRLLLLGGAGTALATSQAVLAAVLLLSVFAVSVLEAAGCGRWRGAGGERPPLAPGRRGVRAHPRLPPWPGCRGGWACQGSCCWPPRSACSGSASWKPVRARPGRCSGVTGGMYLLLVLITGALSWRRL